MPNDGAPDWGPIIGGIAAVVTAIGGVFVARATAARGKTSDEDHRRTARDTAATANATLTLDSVFKLVNELQEENTRKSAEIERVERLCRETEARLLLKIGELEAEVRALKAQIKELDP